MYAHRTYRRDDTKPVAVAKEVIDDGISYDIIPDISTDGKQTSQPTTPSILAEKRFQTELFTALFYLFYVFNFQL